jgi:UDP-N-acetylmuramyl pentapeptide phosphotransferase/UDP-N-acetylglucosamine-1-phosphate transferase
MDGIDGIATTEIICVATGCSLIITLQHRFDEIVLSFILLAVSAVGFLFWNWPPARVFMGDAGSCFLGYSLGALILIAIARGSLSLVVPLILLAVFIIDATLTLIKRFARGEKWYMPHRAHAFQHAAKRFGHLKTTLAVAGINILWLTPLAILAQRRPGESWLVLIIAWFPVVVLAQLLHVGEHREIAEGELFYKFFNGETSLKTWKMLSLWRDRSALPRPFIVVRLTKIVILAEISLLSIYLAFLSQSPVSIMAGRRLFSLEVLIWAGVQCMVLMLFKMDRSHWRLLSIEEIPTIGGMSLVASLIGALSAFVVSPRTTNKTQQHFVLLECLFFVLLTVGLQVAVSLIRSVQHSRGDRGCKRRVLIFSADQTGADILASLRRMCPECDPLGFVDAREETRGTYLSGLPVLGGTHDIFNIADTYNVRELLISSVHVGSSSALGLVQLCRVSGINFTVVHSIRQDIQSPELAISGNSDVTLTIGFPDMSGVGRGITSWAANE